jgi:hypothetical protein
VGDIDRFYDSYIGRSNVRYQGATRDEREHLRVLQNTQSFLDDIDVRSTTEMLARHQAQSDGLNEITEEVFSQWNRAETEAYFERACSNESGAH